jgi:hypothetical protein
MNTSIWLQRLKMSGTLVAVAIAMFANGALARSAPVISVTVFPDRITDEGEEAVYTFTLSSPAPRRILVNFFITGFPVEVPDSDFILIGNFNKSRQLVIPAGQTTATITVHSFVEDVEAPVTEVFSLRIVNGARYRIGSPSHAELHIDNLK